MKVESIYISKEHIFFGRYGMGSLNHETIGVDSVRCVTGKGLEGDRFFGYKEDYKGQITFFSKEVFESMSNVLDVHDRSTAVVRRNVIVSGADLNALVGQSFKVQGIEFEGVQECSPCEWMDEAFGQGAMGFLKGQGGLRCRILTDGILEVGG